MNFERDFGDIRCFLLFWVILPANQGVQLSLLVEWPAPTLKFSEIAMATPSQHGHHGTNAETLRRNDQQLKMAGWY
jgi:hypothetical protein